MRPELRSYKVLWLFLAKAIPSVAEVGYHFRTRVASQTKLSAAVMLDDLAMAMSLRRGGTSAVSLRRRMLAGAAVTAFCTVAATVKATRRLLSSLRGQAPHKPNSKALQ